MKRRTLIRWAAAAAALSPFRSLRLRAQVTSLPESSMGMLQDLAAAVLPESLGRQGTDDVALRFAAWVRDYLQGVPLEHGYGHPRLRRTPSSPAERYVAQLDALEQAARRRAPSFRQLEREAQRELLDAALKEAKVEDLPALPEGQHVVSDLMSFYFQSSEANDLCYRSAIGRNKCRSLSIVAERPKPQV